VALHDDPRYDSVKKRAEHRDEIVPLLREALAQRSALEWETVFGETVPCSASRSVADMFDDPQVQAEAMLATFAHPALRSYRGFKQPWVYSRTPGPAPFAAPTLGQHGDEVRRSVAGR
jgi:crotonobetainyl-CoA:carnitine CoA-transferase CaiB-like acyl-CoA transferase